MGIEKIYKECTKWRRERGSYWIFTLKTLTPNGLNLYGSLIRCRDAQDLNSYFFCIKTDSVHFVSLFVL